MVLDMHMGQQKIERSNTPSQRTCLGNVNLVNYRRDNELMSTKV